MQCGVSAGTYDRFGEIAVVIVESDQATTSYHYFCCVASLFTPQPSWLYIQGLGSRNAW